MSKPILVIEDDADIRMNLEMFLEGEGYAVLTANNGQEGIDRLKQVEEKPSMILLDLMMPIKDGFTFRSEQQNDPSFRDIPVVIMTADSHIEEKSIRTAANAALKKPLDLKDLLAVLDRYAPLAAS